MPMKTQTIEIDNDTAMVLKQRAAERGLSVPELVPELATLEAAPADADVGDIAELDRRWKAFEAQGSVAANDDVVRWLQTWGTPAFRSWRLLYASVLAALRSCVTDAAPRPGHGLPQIGCIIQLKSPRIRPRLRLPCGAGGGAASAMQRW